MKNKLQYAYSITVFAGVLVTAYLMMNTDNASRHQLGGVSSQSLRSEATMVDPAVRSLFEMEDELSKLPRNREELRRPTQSRPR